MGKKDHGEGYEGDRNPLDFRHFPAEGGGL